MKDMTWVWAALAATAPVLAILGSLAAWIMRGRAEALRRDDVHAWADRGIAALQALVVIVWQDGRAPLTDAARDERLCAILFDTSILVEQGRLFFRNQPAGRLGKGRPPAYRGKRPAILDPLVLAHQIAAEWPAAAPDARAKMRPLAEECLQSFVSLAQKEVGRSRSAHRDAGVGGKGGRLAERLEAAQ